MTRIYTSPLLEAILEAIRIDGPQSTADLARRLGKLRTSVHDRIKVNRHLFRIHAWERSLRTGGMPSPVWGLAIKHACDAPRPEPLARDEIDSAWRKRNAALLRARYHAKKRGASPWDALMPAGVRRA